MKKSLFLIPIAAMLLCGCDIHETNQTYQIIKQGTDMFVDYIDLEASELLISGTEGQPGCFAYQEFAFDEITEDVLANGAVLVYLIDEPNDYNEFAHDNILPYVYPVRNNSGQLLMQNIRFNVYRGVVNRDGVDVNTGIISIVLEWQDFKIYDQGNYKFKVCILQPGVDDTKKR